MSLCLLLVALAAAPSNAPIAEVWPYQARRLPTGEVEYTYDLTAVKKHGSTPDAAAAHGEEKVKEFLKALPRTTYRQVHGLKDSHDVLLNRQFTKDRWLLRKIA